MYFESIINANDVTHPVGGRTKRILDIAIAGIALLVLSPLIVTVALLIRAVEGGPVFFGHRRVGYNGREFVCWKFRTMVDGARHEDRLSARQQEEFARTRKLQDDPRVTPLGRLLRETSIDELPQLLNIVLGDMSLVGPRPVVVSELQLYGECSTHYMRARPGLTGLWQVSGRSNTTYEQRVALDKQYVSEWSVSSDIAILIRTIPAVVLRDGSY